MTLFTKKYLRGKNSEFDFENKMRKKSLDKELHETILQINAAKLQLISWSFLFNETNFQLELHETIHKTLQELCKILLAVAKNNLKRVNVAW